MGASLDTCDESDLRYEEFLKLFSRNRERLSAYIYSLLPHQADAEDVFQRCSLLLWRKFSEFDRQRSFLPWACGIAHYEIRNFLRSARRDKLQFNSKLMSQLADRRMESLDRTRDIMPALQSCLDSLKDTESELIQIVYERRQTLKQYAQTSGKPLQTIYNRVARIRKMLLECVQRKLAAG